MIVYTFSFQVENLPYAKSEQLRELIESFVSRYDGSILWRTRASDISTLDEIERGSKTSASSVEKLDNILDILSRIEHILQRKSKRQYS